jgi:magnesium-transporting ATPase (P-type)
VQRKIGFAACQEHFSDNENFSLLCQFGLLFSSDSSSRRKGIMLASQEVGQSSRPLWHAAPVQEVLQKLDSTEQGLGEKEAEKRLQSFGPNKLARAAKKGPLQRFLQQFHNVLIYVLLAAAAVTVLLQEWLDAGVIFGVTVVNALIGFIQEGKAERSLESIQGMLAPKALVHRDGQQRSMSAEELVPGDIVLLKAGDKVPADLRLLEARDLQIEEAALTGESVPVSKSIHEVEEEAGLGDRTSMAFSGTLVTYGQGRGVVTATGQQTEIGRISSLLAEVETLTTPLLKQMSRFGQWLTLAILVCAALTFAFGYLVKGFAPGEMFMAAVGLAVAAIPEGLPAIMTITLAIGVQRMAKRRAIIRRLPAVETLGSVSVICSDKTGTLSKNEMTVQTISTPDKQFQVTGVGYEPRGGFQLSGRDVDPKQEHPELLQILRGALLCNEASVYSREGSWVLEGSPTEGALVVAALKAGLEPKRENELQPRKDSIPFSSENKFMATLHHDHQGRAFILLKGAPERIWERCSAQAFSGQDVQDLDLELWQEQAREIASKGQRLLALAVKQAPGDKQDLEFSDVEGGFTFLALFGIIDPPREEAIMAAALLIGRCVAIDKCQSAGIVVKMITGDHVLTAKAIARELGIDNWEQALTGQELERMSQQELEQKVPYVDVFARTSPEHKLRLVQAIQANRQTVAMTGDGVNDAPALKRADVGVAMGRGGTEAAKEASDMVLADDNFASIASAVEEGRTVYDNLKKAILFILPTNGGQALVIIASIILGLGMLDAEGHFALPITPPQILWINMVTAVTLALALAFEPSEANVMRRPPRPPDEPIISGFLIWRVAFVSLLLVLGALGHYVWLLDQGAGQDLAGTAAINTLVVGQIFYLLNSRHIYASVWNPKKILDSKPVLWSVLAMIALQLIFTYAGHMQYLFQTKGLDAIAWSRIIAFGLLLFILVELEKTAWRRLRERGI